MAFTADDPNTGILNSIGVARQRRVALIQGNQNPLIDPDRMNAAFERRRTKLRDRLGGDMLPLLPKTGLPPANGSEAR